VTKAYCEKIAESAVLDVKRSFWEKATILHTEYHRPTEKPTPDRFSRHYADTAALSRHPTGAVAIDQHELRDRVVAWKGQFFGSKWAKDDLARPGTFRLVPPDERLPELRRDYQAMKDMYLSEPPEFSEILAVLADLEQRINGTVER
jgi:Nucleotidyl transferase AbiEii toxin, Type IV TA system